MRLLSRRLEDAVAADIDEVEALSCRSSTLAVTRRAFACLTALILLSGAAMAGPPYISDDPEPTDYRHYEIYLFSSGTNTESGTSGASGIDFNYGAARDVQLTAVLPLDYATANSGKRRPRLGQYRARHEIPLPPSSGYRLGRCGVSPGVLAERREHGG
jgi:hypothetical protein